MPAEGRNHICLVHHSATRAQHSSWLIVSAQLVFSKTFIFYNKSSSILILFSISFPIFLICLLNTISSTIGDIEKIIINIPYTIVTTDDEVKGLNINTTPHIIDMIPHSIVNMKLLLLTSFI